MWVICQSIATRIQWPTLCIRHFQMYFLEWKLPHLVPISLNVVLMGLIDNNSTLVQVNRLQTITWSNVGQDISFNIASLGHSELTRIFIPKCPIYNKPASDQIMDWQRKADKRLSEAVTVLYTDAYMRHLPRWVFGNIIIFHTILRMFCVYVSWRHIDPYSVCNRPCFDLFWYHWLFCIGLWWPVDHFCAVRLLLLASSPGAGEVTLLSGVHRNPGTNPGMDQNMGDVDVNNRL